MTDTLTIGQVARIMGVSVPIVRALAHEHLGADFVDDGLAPWANMLKTAGWRMTPRNKRTERNDEIRRLRAEEHLTLAELGRRYDITGERVRQILDAD